MVLSQKTQYALRAIFDLALHHDEGARKISQIAAAQAVPHRFLEVIMHEMKHQFVAAKRGRRGGYSLLRDPAELSVGDVIRFIQGPIALVQCSVDAGKTDCSLAGACVFRPLWAEAEEAVRRVYDSATFQDLVEQERRRMARQAQNYAI